MPESKYEIRSEEVQKMMNTPVNRRVLWGSTFILILLLGGVIAFNSVVITEYRNGIVYMNSMPDNRMVRAIVKNEDTANSLHKQVYFDAKPVTVHGYIEQIIPLNSVNSCWLIRADNELDTSFHLAQLKSYRMIYRKKSMFAYIKRHFGL